MKFLALFQHIILLDYLKKIDRKEFSTLRQVFKGFATFPNRQSDTTNPIRNYELNRMINKYNSNTSFRQQLFKTMHCFAKGYALRCSEYAMDDNFETKSTIHWKDIEIYSKTLPNNSKIWYSKFTINWSKTNKKWKQEILTKQCICNKKFYAICTVHNIANYYGFCKQFLDVNKNSVVFRYKNGKPVTTKEFRIEFNNSLKYIGITPNYPNWRANSLRHGEITDQIAAGISEKEVQKFARHVFGSKSTWIYTHLSSEEEADKRHILLKKYYS